MVSKQAHRQLQLLVAQIVAELLERLERPESKQSLSALDFIEGKLHRITTTINEL